MIEIEWNVETTWIKWIANEKWLKFERNVKKFEWNVNTTCKNRMKFDWHLNEIELELNETRIKLEIKKNVNQIWYKYDQSLNETWIQLERIKMWLKEIKWHWYLNKIEKKFEWIGNTTFKKCMKYDWTFEWNVKEIELKHECKLKQKKNIWNIIEIWS